MSTPQPFFWDQFLNLNTNQGFGSVSCYLADQNPLDPDPAENAIKSKSKNKKSDNINRIPEQGKHNVKTVLKHPIQF